MLLKVIYLICLILVLAGAFYLLYPTIENGFVFFPETRFDGTPDDYHLQYREVFFDTGDGKRLHGWFFPLRQEAPIILFCHGNAGNISHRLENVRLLLDQKLQVFIFDYRGYGRSSGRPSEKGLYVDGLAAYDYLTQREHIAPTHVIIFGRSLGAAVAVEISLARKVRSIIIESAFTSTKEMARTIPVFYLVSFFLPANYNNLEKIGHITVPKLIIHGKQDEIVPFSMGERLFEAAKDRRYLFPINAATHNDTFVVGGEKYFETIASFAHQSKI